MQALRIHRCTGFEPEHLPGTVVAGSGGRQYRIGASLGAGGMGHVFAGVSLDDGAPVAIKVLRAELVDTAGELSRFEREVETLRRFQDCDHPNLVRFIDSGTTVSGEPVLVTELLRGKCMQAVLGRDRRLPPRLVAQLARQALHGLAHIHRAGVVHRDLKPANIFLAANADGSGSAKLIDFGLALEPGSEDIRLTVQGRIVGTVWYLSPEQVSRGTITTSSDLYSLGVVLYRALTGFHPIHEKGPALTLIAHLRTDPTPVDWASLGIDPALGALVMTCLAKDPAARPASAAALRDALGAFIA